MMPDVHSIPQWCGQVQIRETAQSIENMVKEHHQHIHPRQPKKLVVAKHSYNRKYHIQLQDT